MIRPEIRDWISRWSEVLIAGLVTLAGLWIALRGGWFLAAVGLALAGIGATLMLGARRRIPFLRPVAAPGVVEIDEGAIRFYGAVALGGEIPLRDLTEIRLMRLKGHAHWRLRSSTGEALLIPVDAAGAERLADAFTSLPGLDMGSISTALAQVDHQLDAVRTVWRRPG
jgi:hypothetical protein